jgi:hypothetical protein
MKNGVVNVEVRGALTGETLALITGAASAGAGGQSLEAGKSDVGTVGYGVQAAVNTSAIDLIGGFDERRIHQESIPELSVGLRKRFGSPDTPFYVFALARSSRSDSSSADVFNGSALGLGVLIQFAENGFIDTSIAWEHTNDLAIPNADTQTDEGVFQIGIGWSF